MKLFKQPWFLIALFLLSVYTYYLSDSSFSVSTNTAVASEESAEGADPSKKETLKPQFSKKFTASKVKSLELATYQNLDIKFLPTDEEEMTLELSGQGSLYKAEGKDLKDWLDISLRRGVLKIKSYKFKGSKSGSMKVGDLLGQRYEKLSMVLHFPKDKNFRTISVESVSSDIVAQGLKFKKMSVESVSGDVKFEDGSGQDISLATVSGDLNAKNLDVKSGAFKSVSGDSRVATLVEKPQFSFESVSGDVSLSLPASAQVNVDFSTMTGELNNEFGSSSGSAGQLKISSLSGDAEVTKIK